MNQRRGALGSLLVGLLALPAALGSHELTQSDSTLSVQGSTIRVRFTLNLLALPGVDANADTRVSYEELDASIEQVFSSIKDHFVLRAPGSPVSVVAERYDIIDDHVLRMDLRYAFADTVRWLEVSSALDTVAGAEHQHYASAVINGRVQRAVLDSANRSARFTINGVTFGRVAASLGAGLLVATLIVLRLKSRQL